MLPQWPQETASTISSSLFLAFPVKSKVNMGCVSLPVPTGQATQPQLHASLPRAKGNPLPLQQKTHSIPQGMEKYHEAMRVLPTDTSCWNGLASAAFLITCSTHSTFFLMSPYLDANLLCNFFWRNIRKLWVSHWQLCRWVPPVWGTRHESCTTVEARPWATFHLLNILASALRPHAPWGQETAKLDSQMKS